MGASIQKFFSGEFQPQRTELSVNTFLFLSARAIALLLPFFFISRLRKTVGFRARGSCIALIFIIPVLIEPTILAGIGDRNWSDNILILVFFMLIGFAEELVFRGYAFQLCPDRRLRETIVVTSLIFALVHFPQYSYNPFLCARAFFLGIGLGIVRLATGSIGLAAVIHCVVNFVIQLNDSPSYHQVWYAFCVAATVALYLHPSCSGIPEANTRGLCGANT